VRHVRILGLCLAAALAVAAIGATSALAKKSEVSLLKVFSNCPVNMHPNACTYGKSNNKSFYTAGKAVIQMVHPVTLQGGLIEEFNENGEFKELGFQLPENGTSILTKVAQPAPSLTEGVDPELLSPAEKERYEKFVADGKTKVTATIETAGYYKPQEVVNLGNLLNESGTALKFEVQVKLSNPFLGKDCTVGTNTSPINIELTTGQSGKLHGKAGKFNFHAIGMLEVEENELVNNEYTSPGVTDCGNANGADAAIDAALGLPSAAGENETVIAGTLDQAAAELVAENGY
jgi:hypothetical protein